MDASSLKAGYLHKRGRGIHFSYIRPWDRRWITLDLRTAEMIYYEDIIGSTRVEKGRLNLAGSEVAILKDDTVGKPFAFEIFFKDSKRVGITLACRSMGELMDWVAAAQEAQSAGCIPPDHADAGENAAAAYDMEDIDVDDYSPSASPAKAARPMCSPSFADIDEDEPPPAPAVILMQPPSSGDNMNDIDEDSYSRPKDIDEEEEDAVLQPPPARSAAVGSRIRPTASDDSHVTDIPGREGPRGYLSPSAGPSADWWEPGGGDEGNQAARDFGENLQIKIKIRRLDHCFSRLGRRLLISRLTSGFSTGCEIQAMRALLGQMYGNTGDVDIDRADWTALFAAMFLLEEGESPPPAHAQLSDLRVIILAEISPGQHRVEVAVRPWDMLPDIAAALASALSIQPLVAETALKRGMGEMSSGKRFSLYPKAIELLMEELGAAERSMLTRESMMLNIAASDGAAVSNMPSQSTNGLHIGHDYNAPYVPSFLGHAEDEFIRADEDGDGMISRVEWRKWITEKERIIRVHNNEKAYLIKETRSLRKALTPVQEQAYEALMQSEAKREATEMDLVQRTQEHRKVLSELARAKIRVAQLEATVAAYEESGARIASTISLQKIHNAIATEMTAVSESVTDSNADSSRQDDLRDNYADMNENNYDSFNNPYVPTPKSWVRNYVSTDIDYAAGKTPELTTVPPSIAEVNRHKSGDMLSERGAKDLKATLAKLGRDTTLQVVTGVYPSSSNAQRNDLGHWDTLNLQMSSRRHSPEKAHVLHQALRSAQPSPTEKMSLNSRGNLSVIHRIFEEREHKRLTGSPMSANSSDMAQARYRRNLRKDYMAPTVTSSGKEKPGMTSPTTAVKGGSGWF